MHTSRSFTFSKAMMTHVTFPNDAAFTRIFRHVVRTFENAVRAANALVIEVTNDTGIGVFFVSADGTAIHAPGIFTVMTSGGDGLLPARC